MPNINVSNTMTTKNTASAVVVEDKNAHSVFDNGNNVISSSKSKANIADLDEVSALFDASIIAKPLMQPEGLALIEKNREYVYHWVAFKVRDGQNIERYKQLGFTKATLNDVTPVSSKATEHTDGIIYGDLLLMKIPKSIYFPHLKENYRRANVAFTRNALLGQVNDQFPNGVPTNSSGRPYIEFYTPATGEIDKSMQRDSPRP